MNGPGAGKSLVLNLVSHVEISAEERGIFDERRKKLRELMAKIWEVSPTVPYYEPGARQD